MRLTQWLVARRSREFDVGLAALSAYAQESVRVQEGRLQSIDNQAAGIGTAVVGLVVATVALLGSKHFARAEFVIECSFAVATLIFAVFARADHPSPLEWARRLRGEGKLVKRLEDAETAIVAWQGRASLRPPESLLLEAWDARRSLLSARAESKSTWLDASLLGLYLAISVPVAVLLIRLLFELTT